MLRSGPSLGMVLCSLSMSPTASDSKMVSRLMGLRSFRAQGWALPSLTLLPGQPCGFALGAPKATSAIYVVSLRAIPSSIPIPPPPMASLGFFRCKTFGWWDSLSLKAVEFRFLACSRFAGSCSGNGNRFASVIEIPVRTRWGNIPMAFYGWTPVYVFSVLMTLGTVYPDSFVPNGSVSLILVFMGTMFPVCSGALRSIRSMVLRPVGTPSPAHQEFFIDIELTSLRPSGT